MVKLNLRVQKGIELSQQGQEELCKVLGNDIEITHFDPEAFDFSQSIQDRIHSLSDAFRFVVEQGDPRFRASLCRMNDKLLEEYDLEPHLEPKLAEQKLGEFVGQLVLAMCRTYSMDEKTAVETLNLAEQYRLWQKGRPDHATLSLLSGKEKDGPWLLQVDRRLAPVHKDTQEELEIIKESEKPERINFEFQRLPLVLQIFLLDCWATSGLYTEASHYHKDLNFFIHKINMIGSEEVKKIPDLNAPLKSYFNNLCGEAQGSENTIKETLESHKNLLSHFFQQEPDQKVLKNLSKLPLWYHRLGQWEKNFLWSSLQKMDMQQSKQWFLPSRLRRVPVLANGGIHEIYSVSPDDDTVKIKRLSKPRKRSAHPASRLITDKLIQSLHIDRNLEQLQKPIGDQTQNLSKNPFFIGTLISPLWGVEPDSFLDSRLSDGVGRLTTRGGNVIRTNHALNLAKRIQYTTENTPLCNIFLSTVQTKAETFTSDHRIHVLIKEYQSLLRQRPAWYEWNALNELWLASLEHLIALELGFTVHGCCVSGKDRQALLLLMTDSFLVFYEQNSRWPQFSFEENSNKNKDKEIVRSIFVDLLLTRHQQNEAAFNAPGACGIKGVTGADDITNFLDYLPAEWALENSYLQNRLASINEVSSIELPDEATRAYQYRQWLKKDWLDRVESLQDKEVIREVLDTVHKVTQQDGWPVSNWTMSSLWNRNVVPNGIREIRDKMTNYKETTTDPAETLVEILLIARRKLDDGSWGRHEKTNQFYESLDHILLEENLADKLPDLKKALDNMIAGSRPPSPQEQADDTQTLAPM